MPDDGISTYAAWSEGAWPVRVGWESGSNVVSIPWYRRNVRPVIQSIFSFGTYKDEETRQYEKDALINDILSNEH